MRTKNKSWIGNALIAGAVLVTLVSAFLYYYPELDGWLVTQNLAVWRGLTVYSPQKYGVVHTGSLIMGSFVTAVFVAAIPIQNWLVENATGIVSKWQQSEREAEQL